MNTDKFMTFDEYVADLESNHRWQKDAFEYRRKATEIVHEHGGPEFRDFSLSEYEHDECVPCRDMPKAPELQQLAQHSRVTVVTREQSHYFGGYVHRSMVIFDVSEKNVEGYLYGHSQLRLELVEVNKDQIIECLPALRVGESDSCDVAGDIPF